MGDGAAGGRGWEGSGAGGGEERRPPDRGSAPRPRGGGGVGNGASARGGVGAAAGPIAAAGRAMDADVMSAAADEQGRLTHAGLRPLVDGPPAADRGRVTAIFAPSCPTNRHVLRPPSAAPDSDKM